MCITLAIIAMYRTGCFYNKKFIVFTLFLCMFDVYYIAVYKDASDEKKQIVLLGQRYEDNLAHHIA